MNTEKTSVAVFPLQFFMKLKCYFNTQLVGFAFYRCLQLHNVNAASDDSGGQFFFCCCRKLKGRKKYEQVKHLPRLIHPVQDYRLID